MFLREECNQLFSSCPANCQEHVQGRYHSVSVYVRWLNRCDDEERWCVTPDSRNIWLKLGCTCQHTADNQGENRFTHSHNHADLRGSRHRHMALNNQLVTVCPAFSPVCCDVCCQILMGICLSWRASSWPGTALQRNEHLRCPTRSRTHPARPPGRSCSQGTRPGKALDICIGSDEEEGWSLEIRESETPELKHRENFKQRS